MIKDIICESSKLLPGNATTAVVVSSDQQPTPSRREGGCYSRTGHGLFLQRLIKALLFFALFFLSAFSSCKKLVTVDPPASRVVTSSVFSNDFTATEALTSIYSQMSVESYNMAKSTGILGDELINYNTLADQRSMSANSMDAITNNSSGCWFTAYNYIYQANAVIAGLSSYSGVSAAASQQLTGEARFLRAFWYFYLTNEYGAVPLATTTDFSVNSLLSRTDTAHIYLQIIANLQSAESLLNSQYVDFTDTANTITLPQRVRPNKAAAAALLARAFLYTKQYDSAAVAATRVISNTALYKIEPVLNNVFKIADLSTSHEAIWQLQTTTPFSGGANTFDGNAFILTTKPPSGNTNTSLSLQLLSSFETGDLRRMNWIHDTTIAAAPYSYPFKYKISSLNTSTTLTEYVMMLRLAEQYLIRAEAEAYGAAGGLGAAVSDLNVIRYRAGLPNYAGTVDQPSVLAAILHERQVELFTEWGNRWFDLRRTGTIDAVMTVVNPLKGGTGWVHTQSLFPIPNQERINDPNLTQNPGYN